MIYVKVDTKIGDSRDMQMMSLEKALKKFKRKVKKSELMLEIQKNEFYVKPSTKRRMKKMKSIARNKYRMSRESENGQ